MSDTKPEETFRVIDRRPFASDGSLREGVAEEERAREQKEQAAAAAQPKPAATLVSNSTSTAPAASSILSPSGSAAAPALAAEATAAQAAVAPSRGFQLLVSFLAQNCAALLGAYADPRTGQAMLDLDGAREMIDMLDALREKTKGNLAAEEDRILLEVIGSLKMSFLEMSKAAAEAMKKQAPINPTKK